MTALSDLTPHAWTPVARRVRADDKHDGWEWDLPSYEVSALQLARLHGAVLTAQKRNADGVIELRARLVMAKWRYQPGPAAFALQGRMFER